MAAAISVRGLTKRFGSVVALKDVSFSSTKGVNIILGPNGAGKSTLIKCIDGLYAPDSGTVRVLGMNPYTDIELKENMSLLTDNYALYDFLSVEDNMRFFGRLYGLDEEETDNRVQKTLKRLEALQYLRYKINQLSRGTKQKIALCRALLCNPEVLLLDEPTAFLDARSAQEVRSIMLEISEQGGTVLFVTQKLDEVTRFNGSITIISRGRLVKSATTESLYRDVLKGSVIHVRVAKPISVRAARRLPMFDGAEGDSATLLKFRVASYRDINGIVERLAKAGTYVVSVDYTEPFIEDITE